MTGTGDETTRIARRLSDRIGPFRRTLLRTSRAVADLPDVPDAQIEVMRALSADPAGTAPSSLAARLGLARSTVSNLVSAMEQSGLVERRVVGGDGRRATVHLTPLATERLRTYDEAATAVLVDALARLSDDDRTALAAALPALERLHHEITPPPAR
ncbi:MarR family winged helix-turn-helix transcriptional regulator [Curtobacterium caseinilyticum]|uniref:MarR family transcriptional regulator n=1 Tax=Curtobacterium caseinilyticum TaxID=3055137 RepID=A0ABT7TS36_9MICO|nr:MarR family transcriptional regulator [Curtobacterium caseinilyticum]MDM7892306.1 MarR family transcriptional regulator [Curtobacterium caseinilyticum]